MVRRISIILLILVALAGPASAGVVVFSLVAYFGNIGDQPGTFPINDQSTTLDTASANCPNLKKVFRDGSVAGTIINAASKSTGVEAAQIAAQIDIESSFDQDAASDGGGGDKIAYGLMQTIPPTYMSNKRTADPTVTYQTAQKTGTTNKGKTYEYDVYRVTLVNGKNPILENPESAVFAGAKYYRTLLDKFDNNPDIAVAAYNAGPEHIIERGWKKGKPKPKLFDKTEMHIVRFQEALKKYRGCQTQKSTATSSDHATAIVAEAKKYIGQPSVSKYGVCANRGCTSFTKAVIDPIAATNFNLSTPDAWSANDGGTKIKDASQVQPGDVVFWIRPGATGGIATPSDNQTDFPTGTEVPTHVGIYIGAYNGPDGRGKTISLQQASIQNSSSGIITVEPLNQYRVHGIKRY